MQDDKVSPVRPKHMVKGAGCDVQWAVQAAKQRCKAADKEVKDTLIWCCCKYAYTMVMWACIQYLLWYFVSL